MQNWESMPQANYDHNWYGSMFSAIKREQMTSAYNMDQQNGPLLDTNFNSPTSSSSQHHQQSESHENQTFYGVSNNNHPLGFNPLTPPGYPNPIIPQMNYSQELNYQESSNAKSTLSSQLNQTMNNNKILHQTEIPPQSITPSHTPPMDITPPKSPKSLPGTPDKDNEISSNSNDSGEDTRFLESDNDDESISKPKFNSHGKVKKFKCKQCGYIAITKVDFWAHAKEHIKPEKLLECHLCPFVTELKHHLEYHIRKHNNLKPFRCDQCTYSCVNKSMLNSHLKSHSKVYQYRCTDCDYATKYCHSFKLHLRKYTHKPGMVLNEDGTPNPLIVIDVYGTRRGPKVKGRENSASSKLMKQEARNLAQQSQPSLKTLDALAAQARIPSLLGNQTSNIVNNLLPSTIANMLQQSRNLTFFPYINLNLQMLAAQQQVLAQLSPSVAHEQLLEDTDCGKEASINKQDSDFDESLDHSNQNSHSAMDLTQTSPIKASTKRNKVNSGGSITATPVLSTSKTSRRKGRAFRFDVAGNDEDADEALTRPAKLTLENYHRSDHVEKKDGERATVSSRYQGGGPTLTSSAENGPAARLVPKYTSECKPCGIYFRDTVLHTIHMGYHSCDDEFKCNMCGERCGDPLTFFVHIARVPHS